MIYRTAKDIMSSKVTMKINETGWLDGKYIQSDLPLATVIAPHNWEKRCDEVAAAPYHSEQQKKLKAAMPRFFIAGTFPKYAIRDKEVIDYTNLICVDIDGKDNPDKDLDEIRKTLFEQEYVFAVYLSASRKGLYAIIPILDGREAPAYCNYIRRLWKFKYNIVTDQNSENIARARIISYDKDWMKWTKVEDVKVWELKTLPEQEEKKPEKKPLVGLFETEEPSFDTVARTHLAMQRLVTDGYTVNGYNRWLRIGCEMRNFSDGFEMWYTMTINNTNYHDFDRKKLERKFYGFPIANLDESVHRKWQGIAKQRLGEKWWE